MIPVGRKPQPEIFTNFSIPTIVRVMDDFGSDRPYGLIGPIESCFQEPPLASRHKTANVTRDTSLQGHCAHQRPLGQLSIPISLQESSHKNFVTPTSTIYKIQS
jgi:hypothetical protein